jgi:hypothetical protein
MRNAYLMMKREDTRFDGPEMTVPGSVEMNSIVDPSGLM